MNGSGSRLDRPSPVILRLLPHVKPPPARVLVVGLGTGHEVQALDARGYEVTVVDPDGSPSIAGVPILAAEFADADFAGRFDLVCEHGAFTAVGREGYVAAAAKALRPGGQLFGAFSVDASALMHAFAPHFDLLRCQPASGGEPVLEAVLRRR